MPPIENSPHKTGKSMLFFTFEMPLFSVMSINSQIYMTKPKQAQTTLSENTGKTFFVIMPPFSSRGGGIITEITVLFGNMHLYGQPGTREDGDHNRYKFHLL